MSYYMGDFYPRGDPGIGSFFGGLIKKAVGFIPGVGPVLSAIMPGGAKTAARPVAGAITEAAGSAVSKVGSMIVKHPVLSAAGAAGATGALMGAGAEKLMGGGAVRARGTHPCKSKHGCKHGAMVPNRRMNSCNPRALRRAVRRLHSFARHYRKVVGFVSPHPKKGRMYFKKRKRS